MSRIQNNFPDQDEHGDGKIRIMITEVTEMRGDRYCVAGWDIRSQRMVRPLPDGENWTEGLLRRHGVVPGVSFDVTVSPRQNSGLFPHRTEDTVIYATSIRRAGIDPVHCFDDSPPAHRTVREAFAGRVAYNKMWRGVRQGVHVPVGTRIGSLAAIDAAQGSFRFLEEFEKLRVVLDDGIACYELAVSGRVLKTAWRDGGIRGVQRVLPQTAIVHIRLGLARAFDDDPGKCYLMLNGIHGQARCPG